jgi:hypothetical protein
MLRRQGPQVVEIRCSQMEMLTRQAKTFRALVLASNGANLDWKLSAGVR